MANTMRDFEVVRLHFVTRSSLVVPTVYPVDAQCLKQPACTPPRTIMKFEGTTYSTLILYIKLLAADHLSLKLI